MFIPETIDLGESEKYVLSIRISPSNFMFSISDPKVGKNYCLRETNISRETPLLDNIKRIIFDLNFLTQEFLETNVVFVSTDYDIVPISYYEEKNKEILYNFAGNKDDKHVMTCENKELGNITLFGMDSEIYEFLSRSLFNPIFHHYTNTLLHFFEEKNKVTSLSSRMFVNFHDDMMDVVCFSQSKFIHCLTYENEAPANQIYYILQLWKKCNFNQQNDQMMIFGQADKSIMSTLQEYISDIKNKNTPSEVYLWNEDALKAPLDLLVLSL